MKCIPFTEEEKQRANSVDLVDFLQRQGEQLTRAGRDWRWKRHDSVTIRSNRCIIREQFNLQTILFGFFINFVISNPSRSSPKCFEI